MILEYLMGDKITAAIKDEFAADSLTSKINSLYVTLSVGLVTLQGAVTLIKWVAGAINV